jgi:hypothetical protein
VSKRTSNSALLDKASDIAISADSRDWVGTVFNLSYADISLSSEDAEEDDGPDGGSSDDEEDDDYEEDDEEDEDEEE